MRLRLERLAARKDARVVRAQCKEPSRDDISPRHARRPRGPPRQSVGQVRAILPRRRFFELAAWEVYPNAAKPWREATNRLRLMRSNDYAELIYAQWRDCAVASSRGHCTGGRKSLRLPAHAWRDGVLIAPLSFARHSNGDATIAAAALGTTVVIKPAEISPSIIGAKLWRFAKEAEIPPGRDSIFFTCGRGVGAHS